MQQFLHKYWMEVIAVGLVVSFWSIVYVVQHSPAQDISDPAFQRQVQEEIQQP